MAHFRRSVQLGGFFVAAAMLAAIPATMSQETTDIRGVKHGPIDVQRNPDGTPGRGIRNQWLSNNWSGYELANFQTSQTYTQAQMTWVVPTVTYGQSTDSTSSSEYSANWVGIGGFCANRLCS